MQHEADQPGGVGSRGPRLLSSVAMREQRVRICIQEIRRSKAPQLLRECGHGGKPLVERRDLVWPHPQLRHPIEKHAKRLLRIGLADGVEPGGPEPRRSENAGKPAVMRK